MPVLAVDRPVSIESANSLGWCEHFRQNADRQRGIPWDEFVALTNHED